MPNSTLQRTLKQLRRNAAGDVDNQFYAIKNGLGLLPSVPKLCGAKTKSNDGKPCRRYAAKGRLRCPVHGGFSTGRGRPKARASEALTND